MTDLPADQEPATPELVVYTANLFGGSHHGQTRQIQGTPEYLYLPLPPGRPTLHDWTPTSSLYLVREVYRRVSDPSNGQINYEYERTTT